MRLAVDGSCWGGRERGVAVSTRRLWVELLRHARTPAPIVFARASVARQLDRATVVEVGSFSGPSRFIWQQTKLPRLLREHQVEVLHCPAYTAPLAARCRTIVTVHDLIAWTHPRLAGWRNALHLRMVVGRAVTRASAVCVPTEVVARAVTATFGVQRSKVFVVPWGTDAELVVEPRERASRDVATSFGLCGPYVLFCGCVEPKKNLHIAVEAATRAGLPLIIVGPTLAASPAILRGSNARHLGYVTPRQLSSLYAAATALIMPSIAEGFGMPAIEAMRCGCPVVASDTPVFREVCADAAMFASPDAPDVFATALRSIHSDAAHREELVGRGQERATKFTWRSAASCFSAALHHSSGA